MERRWRCVVLVGAMSQAWVGCGARTSKGPDAAMIEDTKHLAMTEGKAAAQSGQHVPFPSEPYPLLRPGETRPLAMLGDLEASARPRDLGERRTLEEPKPPRAERTAGGR